MAIKLKEALKRCDGKEQIQSLTFVTFDSKRKTGGVIKTIKEVVQTGTRYMPSDPKKKTGTAGKTDHWASRTRNFSHAQSTATTKVHIDLILYFNGEKVIW
ncbi:hypothetical protein FUAX_55660 (plasmid) [Fulvitalea axinellae]|uniref:Uncharacterized protein n=1 Tax=Fulvitalea axinellae TaxID=1182444 RepID=A0AAU9D3H9_9BACT|nr:hypothetical protein FUAX_55660 [Fulvitalea axinellae]